MESLDHEVKRQLRVMECGGVSAETVPIMLLLKKANSELTVEENLAGERVRRDMSRSSVKMRYRASAGTLKTALAVISDRHEAIFFSDCVAHGRYL